ncbi:hypothetical protein D5R38_18690 [Serratia marcescens]|uniref:hypothetical protein n=1 Tax=Serratia marcescens TaxID=615 RepID=UPI0010686730|nr:hypothetical protein [Serratia marcescens]TEW83399.1 hypothetical protein D5R38_18690 [Serratia marcescens]
MQITFTEEQTKTINRLAEKFISGNDDPVEIYHTTFMKRVFDDKPEVIAIFKYTGCPNTMAYVAGVQLTESEFNDIENNTDWLFSKFVERLTNK